MAADVTTLMPLESIRSVPLFASLDDETASALRALLEVEQRPAGGVLFQAGDAGDAMYLIEAGRVRIHIIDADGDDVTLAELARGDFFGEMAIIDAKPRSASATVAEEARLAVLARDDFLDFVRRNPDVALKMLAVITTMQAPLIMMSQNRQSEKDRLRADLDYQVNLKNELALAEVMRRLDVLESERLPLLFAEQNARLREQLGNGKR